MKKDTDWESLLDNLPRAKAPLYMHRRILARINEGAQAMQRSARLQGAALAFTIVCLFGLNFWYIYTMRATRQTTEEMISDEYGFTNVEDDAAF